MAPQKAGSTSDRIVLHIINRQTGNRVRRRFVCGETGKPVVFDDKIKGYDVAAGEHMLGAEAIEAAVPEKNKTLTISAFIGCGETEAMYIDRA